MKTIQDFAFKAKESKRAQSNKCVIYTRVSSKEQADHNGSLDTQKKYCLNYAQANKLEVVEEFGGTYESAKSDADRKQFQRMLNFVKRRKDISTIVVFSLDRFSRTGSSASAIIENLRAKGIEVKAVQQDFDTENPMGKMMQDMLMVMARVDNDTRRAKCVTGMQEKLRQGYWARTPPKGYVNTNKYATADKHVIEVNEEGRLIAKAYKMRAKGLSYRSIVEKLGPLGFTTQERHVGQLLENPFYAGFVRDKLIPNEIVKGKHPALVSEKVFIEVNDEKSHKRGQELRSTKEHDDLPLKTFMVDEDTGMPFTGYIAKKGDIPYYKNRHKNKAVNINARKVNGVFKEMLKGLEIKPENKKEYEELVMQKVMELLKDNLEDEKTLTKELRALKLKMNNLEEKFIDDVISQDIFEKHKLKINAKISAIEKQINKTPIKRSNLEKAIKKGIEITSEVSSLWASSDYQSKRQLQNLVFPEGISLNKEKQTVRTSRINSIIFQIAEQQRDCCKTKTGINDFEIIYSRLVENTGVEPVTSTLPV